MAERKNLSTQSRLDVTSSAIQPLIITLSVLALQNHGAPQQAVEIQEVVQEGNSLDITTAARDLEQGGLWAMSALGTY